MTLTRGMVRNAATTPLDARLMDMALIVGNADGSPRPGVLDGDARALVTPLATMNVAVAAADFATTKGAADGVVIFTNDGTVNVAISAAPASNSRITVVWVKHNDNTTGDANSTPVFGTTDGAAAATPTKPAIPTGALELATVRVYAGTTAANGGTNVTTNTYQMTAARGGQVPFRTAVELAAWTNPRDRQEAIVLSESTPRRNGRYVYYAGTGWRIDSPATTRRDRRTGHNMSNALTTMDLDTTVSDSGDFAYASGTFTCAVAGRYILSAQLSAQAAGANVGFLGRLRVNGSEIVRAAMVANTTGGMSCFMERSLTLDVGDTVDFQVFSAVAIGTDVTPNATYVDFTRLGGL